ncbi:hypothetical protein CY35_02G116100 [Sphagnum magellanicum]|nr:hypothetical protein CY35_02G116100 [Sphagnum magellanicum]
MSMFSIMSRSSRQRMLGAFVWVLVAVFVFSLLLGICYSLVGYADFSVRRLESTTVPFTNDFSSLTLAKPCLNTTVLVSSTSQDLCAAYLSGSGTSTTWSMRVSLPEYIIALTTIFGSILFVIFGGVGMACLPMSLIATFLRRPKTTISRAQYIKEATYILKRGKDIKEVLLGLQREERAGSKGRKWKKNVLKMQKELIYLEQDDEALTEVFPQGEKADTSWALTVISYLTCLFFGIVGGISGLLGTVGFGVFCLYLLLAVISGEVHLGLNFLFIQLHPMKWNGTLMNSFLFNVGLILACSISVIQFCAKAFSLYVDATAVQQIFGGTLQTLRGIKYLFRYNVFQIMFIILAFLTILYYMCCGWRKKGRAKNKFVNI